MSVQKDDSQVRQKEMIAAHYRRLSRCPETGEMVFHKDLEANQFVFPNSGYHQRVDARTRLRLFFDDAQL